MELQFKQNKKQYACKLYVVGVIIPCAFKQTIKNWNKIKIKLVCSYKVNAIHEVIQNRSCAQTFLYLKAHAITCNFKLQKSGDGKTAKKI